MKPFRILIAALLLACFLPAAYAEVVAVPADQTADFVQQIENGPWTSYLSTDVDAPALYMYHWRRCPYCKAFDKTDKDDLLAAGVDIRLFAFPTPRETRNDLAWLAHKRDLAIYKKHLAGRSIGAPNSQSSSELVQAFNSVNRSLDLIDAVLKSATGNRMGPPGFVYKDASGRWFVLNGYTQDRFAPVKTALLKQAADAAAASQ